MAEISENNLRDEEITGKFSPGTPDDETFYLENIGDYPGEMPDYSDLEIEEKISLEDQLEKPVDDDSIGNAVSSAIPVVIGSAESDVSDISYDNIDGNSLLNDEDEPKLTASEESTSVWDLFDEDKTPKPPETTAAVLGEDFEEPVELDNTDDEIDNELKQILESDLSKSKDRKDKPANLPAYSNISDDDDDFHSIEEEGDFDEIDLSKLDAKHPSSYNLDKQNIDGFEFEEPAAHEEIINEPVEEQIILEEIVKEEPKPEIPKVIDAGKKKKSPFFYAAAILFFLLFLAVTYDWGLNRGGIKDYFGFVLNTNETVEVPKSRIDKSKNNLKQIKPDVKETINKVDTLIVESIKKKEILKNTNPEIVSIPKPKRIVRKNKIFSSSKSANENKYSFIQPIPSKNDDKLFTVQVYASPSKEDAESWIRKLQGKQINDIFLSTQKKRDKDWYRVRFGVYKTEEEAKQAAIKFGFSQAWIDRVK